MERERLSNVLNELIELQWTCKGMLNDKTSKREVYDDMIKQVSYLIEKNHQENNPVHKPLSH